jgi:putative membrane-bound dehydrogenase-like protein
VAEPHQVPSPAEILQGFRLDAGLRIELAACEPQVQSPVAMAFDERGRLWVVEMRDYPNGPPAGAAAEGRIQVLEDRDGDGFFEQATTFADGLLFANGLLPWKGGVLVTAAPHILYLKDTDGDGRADLREPWFEGFTAQNPQLRVSCPLLGPDGWVYVVNGLRGGQIRRSGRPEAPAVNLSGMDFRFDPLDPDRFEAISGMGQFGQTFDDWGNRFVCDNNRHLRHVVFDVRYLRRNPYLAVASVLQDTSEQEVGPLWSGVRIYPLSRNWTTSSLHAGRFTAACGVFLYRGDLLGRDYLACAFTCDPTGNLVHQERLVPHGATFRSRPAQDGVEFLAHPSDWFRPVYLSSGPDGALYVVDMCRAVVEHPEFMPEELKNRPDLLWGKDKGRIWRVVPAQPRERRAFHRLDRLALEDLVAVLEHDNAWHRDTATRLLLERAAPEAVPLLIRMSQESRSPVARLLAGRLVQRLDPRSAQRPWLRLLQDEDPRVRRQAIAMLTPADRDQDAVVHRLLELSADADPAVRFQAALALGDVRRDDDAVLEALCRVARQGAGDPWTRLAVACSVPERAAPLLKRILTQPPPAGPGPEADQQAVVRVAEELARIVGARQQAVEVAEVLRLLLEMPPDQAGWQIAVVDALAQGMQRRGTLLVQFLQQMSDRDLVHHFQSYVASRLARFDAEKEPGEQDVSLLAYVPWEQARDRLRLLVGGDYPPGVRLAAVRVLALHRHPERAGVLLASWRGYTPALRRAVLETLLQDEVGRLGLLEGIARAEVRPADLDPASTQRLLADADPEIRRKAQELLRPQLPPQRREVLARYRAALDAKGDPKRGQEVFRKNCAGCHRVAGIGVDVGPDISDTRTKTPEALLTDILDPNQAIDGNYVNYAVLLKDGRVLTGVIASETPTVLVLKRAENQADAILRADIEAIRSSGQSLMPEGLEQTITVAEMADLLAFLKNWRYLDGAVPSGVSGP